MTGVSTPTSTRRRSWPRWRREDGLVAAGEDSPTSWQAGLSPLRTWTDRAPCVRAFGGELLGDHVMANHHGRGQPPAAPRTTARPSEGLGRLRQRPGRLLSAQLPEQLHGHQRRPHGHLRPHRRQARLGRRIGRPLAFPEPANPPFSRRFSGLPFEGAHFCVLAKITAGRGR